MSNVKYLDLSGLQLYDNLIKSTILGELELGDLSTVKALNDAIEAINDDEGNTSVTAKITSALNNLDYDSTNDSGNGYAAKKPLVTVSLNNGQVDSSYGPILSEFAEYVPQVVTPASGTEGELGYVPAVMDTVNTSILATTAEIFTKLRLLGSGTVITLTDDNNLTVSDMTVRADGSTYKLKLGGVDVAKFSIMKETFLKEGSLVYGTALSNNTLTNEITLSAYAALSTSDKANYSPYLKFVVKTDGDGNSSTTTGDTTESVYIPASALIDVYTGAAASDGIITVSVSDSNEITATIGNNTIVWGKLATALLNKITAQKTTITEIAQGNPADKHILVTKTAGSDANGTGDNYVITEVDIASASDLADLEDKLEDDEEVIASSLNDLNDRITVLNERLTGIEAITESDINALFGISE